MGPWGQAGLCPGTELAAGSGTSTKLSSEGESTFLQARASSERGKSDLLKEAAGDTRRSDWEPQVSRQSL